MAALWNAEASPPPFSSLGLPNNSTQELYGTVARTGFLGSFFMTLSSQWNRA
jgi:hypothetical protein